VITDKRAFCDADWAGLGHLAEEFLNDLADDYEEHGKEFVRRLRIDHPQIYIKTLLLLSPLDARMLMRTLEAITPEGRRLYFEGLLKARQEEQAAAPPATGEEP
jgi:hypothetical protein